MPSSSAQHLAGELRGQAERPQGLQREAGVQRDRLPLANHSVAERGKIQTVMPRNAYTRSLLYKPSPRRDWSVPKKISDNLIFFGPKYVSYFSEIFPCLCPLAV